MTNEVEPFMPAWAATHFDKKKNDELEFQMLKHFFASWEALHNLPRDSDHRKKAEAAAQVLVDAAQSINALRAPMERPAVLNG